MEAESYNPVAIYGSFTEKQRSIVAATVAQRKRKARTWFSGFVPVYTTDELNPFLVLGTHLPMWIQEFGNRDMYVGDNTSQALDYLMNITPREVSLCDGKILNQLLRNEVPHLFLPLLRQFVDMPVGNRVNDVEARPVHGFTLRRLSATQFRYYTVLKPPAGAAIYVYRPDMSTVVQLYVVGRVLDHGLLRRWMSIAQDGAEVLYSDFLVRKLPQPTLAELTRRLEIGRPQQANRGNEQRTNRSDEPSSSRRTGRKPPSRAAKAEAQAKQKADAKKKAKKKAHARTKANTKEKESKNTRSSSNGDEPLPTRFARPPNLLPSEVLKMIDMHEKNDYHDVCPEDVAEYVHLMKWQPGDTMQELRAKRDRALGCAVLRQRKKQEHVRRGTHTAGHDHPISRAYALATGTSSQIVVTPGASASNILLDRWLPTRQSLIADGNRIMM